MTFTQINAYNSDKQDDKSQTNRTWGFVVNVPDGRQDHDNRDEAPEIKVMQSKQ